MSGKSPEAYKTISEVAEILGLEQHVLRFWETKFSQIKPMKRRGGRRYYRPVDVDMLMRIHHLLYKQGYTIAGAKKAINEAPVEKVQVVEAIVAQQVPLQQEKQGSLLLSSSPQSSGVKKSQLKNLLDALISLRKDLQAVF